METAEQLLKEKYSRPANKELYEVLENGKVRCYSCGHQCLISKGKAGTCKLRYNKDGVLYAPYDYVAGLAIDPIEKKPVFPCSTWRNGFIFWHVRLQFSLSILPKLVKQPNTS
jgi:pyruvate formate lyase activating enzyme